MYDVSLVVVSLGRELFLLLAIALLGWFTCLQLGLCSVWDCFIMICWCPQTPCNMWDFSWMANKYILFRIAQAFFQFSSNTKAKQDYSQWFVNRPYRHPSWQRMDSSASCAMPTADESIQSLSHGYVTSRPQCHIIGPILWGHSGPLCHALSLLSL